MRTEATTPMPAIPKWLQSTAWAGGSEYLEKTTLSLGIIPLTDCAPLVIAAEQGYFKKYGLKVDLSREPSWANIRDKVSVGALDGAQMLGGMPIAASLGVEAMHRPTITAYSMGLNGNGITVSNALYERMWEADPQALQEHPISARPLKKVIDADQAAGRPAMTFAMVFPVSTHNYLLRYWLASAGIDPDRDLRLIVIPPAQMVASLHTNKIVGYCVGEPWNQRAVTTGIGKTLIVSYEIWNNHPEKVFGVNGDWAERHPNTHKSLIMALLEAAQWLDQPENRLEAVRILTEKGYINAPLEVVKQSMTGSFQYAQEEMAHSLPDFHVFYRYAATFPWLSHAAWFVTQMYRWGQLEKPLNINEVAATVYRPDIYREAAQALDISCPTRETKSEGSHGEDWSLMEATAPIPMGSDCIFDGEVFDPAKPMDYLAGFKIHRLKVSLDELAGFNP